jgi:hypothetical protein
LHLLPLQNSFQSLSPETVRNQFLSVADYRFDSLQVDRFAASGQFLYRFESVVIYRCKIVASKKKSRNVSFRFCQVFVAKFISSKKLQRISVSASARNF